MAELKGVRIEIEDHVGSTTIRFKKGLWGEWGSVTAKNLNGAFLKLATQLRNIHGIDKSYKRKRK